MMDEILVKCADCGETILILQPLIGNEEKQNYIVLTRVAAKCYKCNGFSYVYETTGPFAPGSPSDEISFDILEDSNTAPDADVVFKTWDKLTNKC